MTNSGKLCVLAGVVAMGGGAVAAFPAVAQSASSLAVLDRLTTGQWEVRERGSGSKRQICVRSGYELIQLRHRGAQCSRHVVESGTNEVTIQYTCRGNGYGRTHVRRETGELVQIESQGIADGQPFEFSAEARRTGSCR